MNATALQAGIHRIPMAEYLADPCEVPSLSSGCAWRLISESPLHAWTRHPRLGGRASSSSAASDTGSVAHDLLLGGEGKICEINRADYRSKPTKADPEGSIPVGWTNGPIRAARDAARANGLVPILAEDMIGVRAMANAARKFIATSEIAGVLDEGESELTVISNEGPVWTRTRPDWLNPGLKKGVSLSFKTTQTLARPDNFRRLAANMGYGFQLMFYERSLCEATQSHRIRHVILAQEQSYPYACALYELAPAMAEIQRSQVRRAIGLWERCMATDTWPGYGPRVHPIEPTAWELAAEEERLQEDELEAMQ